VFELTTNGIFTSLISFTGTNGAYLGIEPFAGLTLGKDSNFYGTTQSGGTNDLVNGGDGTMFRMTSAGTLTTLVSLNTTNGANPQAGLVQGSDGNFYGTTYSGGSSDAGTIFKMTTLGSLITLLSFDNTNGANPYASLIQGLDGNFYGTTKVGGANNYGTAFEMTSAGVLTSLVSFDNTNNGAYPVAGLTLGKDGNFYGTTALGGTNVSGTIFRFPPLPNLLAWWQTNGLFTFTWSAATGQNYQAQFKTNLNQNSWNNLGGTVTAVNSRATNSDSMGLNQRRFYRIGLLP
jgi:uncharacterized repeat protein (TIGR03803 family)